MLSRSIRTRALLGAAALVLVAACGSPSPTPAPTALPTTAPTGAPTTAPTGSPSEQPTAAGSPTAILTVTSEGGFINPVATLSAFPSVVVESDGRIFSPGSPSTLGGLVPSVVVRDTGTAGAAAVLEAIKAAGLDQEQTGGGPAPDTGATVFTVTIDGAVHESRFTGGTGGPGGPGVPGGPGGAPGGEPVASGGAPGVSADPGAPDAQAAALDLLAQLTDPSVGWGGPAVTPATYVPQGFQIYAAPAEPPADGTTAAWPLAAGLAVFGRPAVPDFGLTGLRSGTLVGADAATVAPVLFDAAPGTLFTGGGTFTLFVRPLTPDELGG